MLPQARIFEETCIRAESQRSRTCLFYPTSSLSYRKYGKQSHHLLQKTCFLSSYEMGPVILLHLVLATLPPDFLSSLLSHSVYQGSSLQLWLRCQVTASHWLGHDDLRTSMHLNYLSQLFFTHYFVFLYNHVHIYIYIFCFIPFSFLFPFHCNNHFWHENIWNDVWQIWKATIELTGVGLTHTHPN